ncbi:hypothetical protein QA649_08940 [Bradyrhizobium sp. CB1717]|nr:hypothetical protein [Bradyrhizobium sp. CB1717]WFU26316.1 hypothetical protein QA649_08940 [Bradyrhizobium sp. CB1717]
MINLTRALALGLLIIVGVVWGLAIEKPGGGFEAGSFSRSFEGGR